MSDSKAVPPSPEAVFAWYHAHEAMGHAPSMKLLGTQSDGRFAVTVSCSCGTLP